MTPICSALYNGCGSCSPILSLYYAQGGQDNAIPASIFFGPNSPEGEDCGCDLYSIQINLATETSESVCEDISGQFNCNDSQSTSLVVKVDEYGDFITDTYSSRTVSKQATSVDTDPPPGYPDPCTTTENVSYSCSQINQLPECPFPVVIQTNCIGSKSSNRWYGSCSAGQTQEVTCTDIVSSSSSNTPGPNCESYSSKANGRIEKSGPISLQTMYSRYVIPSANTRFEMQKINGWRDIDKCGNGGQDDCWAIVEEGYVTILSPDLFPEICVVRNTKTALKVGILSDDFNKKYKRISGKVYLYTGGTEGKTPCCNNDFDGTIEEEYNFNLNGENNFNPNGVRINAANLGELDSANYQEEITLYYCISIETVEFIT